MLHPETLPLAHAFSAGITAWLIGGRAVRVLEGLGFTHAHGSLTAGDVFYRRGATLVDLVPIRDDVGPPRTLGELAGMGWPPDFLTAHEIQGGCTLMPVMHRAMKAVVADFYGAELRDKDRAGLAALATL